MKKSAVFGLCVVVLVLVGGFLVYSVVFQQDASRKDPQSAIVEEKDACDILTEETAKTILGQSIIKADPSNSADASSDDIVVSQCSYSETTGTDALTPQTQKTVNLLARRPKTDKGKQANSAVFVSGAMPRNATEVEGYGNSAFWNPEFGQLNILKNDTWYIVEFGALISSGRTLEDTKKFADALIAKF